MHRRPTVLASAALLSATLAALMLPSPARSAPAEATSAPLDLGAAEGRSISEIRFVGNATVASDKLRALMDLAPGQVFHNATAAQDVLKLDSYYNSIGFGGQVLSHVIGFDLAPNGVLTVTLREGLTVKNVIVTPAPDADPLLPPSLVAGALRTKPGTVYSDQQRDRDYDAIKALYARHDLKLGDVEAGVDAASVDRTDGTADVRNSVYVMRVGAVEISGNAKTHDDVIRRELRLRPGMAITDTALRHDYERPNNLGFFSKVDFDAKPGPDPKRPGLVTLNWQLKEQRTGNATLGGGYSGGATGTGLTGNVSFSENNVSGTGNAVSLKLQRGSKLTDAQLSLTVPHLGTTERAQKYSLTTSVYTQRQVNAYPVYSATRAPGTSATGTPVSLVAANSTSTLVSGVSSSYLSQASGASATLGRSLSDAFRLSAGLNVQRVGASASLPAGTTSRRRRAPTRASTRRWASRRRRLRCSTPGSATRSTASSSGRAPTRGTTCSTRTAARPRR